MPNDDGQRGGGEEGGEADPGAANVRRADEVGRGEKTEASRYIRPPKRAGSDVREGTQGREEKRTASGG